MTELPNESWISAYLDGELSLDERAQFESWLAENPSAQQLLDELRSLSQTLRALPRLELGDEFAPGVLRRAERAVLLPDTSLPPLAAAADGASARVAAAAAVASDGAPRTAGLDWRRWSRPLLWSALATAASLLIVFFAPDRSAVNSLALRANTEAERGIATATAESDRAVAAAPDSADLEAAPARAAAEPSIFGKDPGPAPLPRDLADMPIPAAAPLAADGHRAKAALDGDSVVAPSAPLDQNLVVLAEVTPLAIREDYFGQVLMRNSVPVENVSTAARMGRDRGRSLEQSPRETIAKSSPDDRGAGDSVRNEDAVRKEDAGYSPRMVYVVEASQEQLAGVLAQLQRDQQEVLALEVDPAPQVPQQQLLANFNRGQRLAADELRRDPLTDEVAAESIADQAPPPDDDPDLQHHAQQTAQPGDALSFEGRQAGEPLYRQNQLRRQIPVEDQRVLQIELRNLSEPDAAVQTVTEPSARVQNMTQNVARARQVDVDQLRQIQLAPLTDESFPLAPGDTSSEHDALPKLSGGGASPKQAPARLARPAAPAGRDGRQIGPRMSQQADVAPRNSVGQQADVAQQLGAAPQGGTVDRAAEGAEAAGKVADDSEASLVRAVFVIQAREPRPAAPAQQQRAPAAEPRQSPQ